MIDKLTLIIPAKREVESLPTVLEELQKINTNFKIKIALEASDTETINSVKNFKCQIYHQKKKGYGSALIEAINTVETKYFCIFNADGSFVPEEIQKMFELAENNNYDFIFGSRYLKKNSSEDDTFITFFGNFLFSKIGNIFFNLPITDILYTFVLGKVDRFRKINFKNHDFRFCVELPIKANLHKMKLIDFQSFERKRIAGQKKVNAFKDGFLILKEMIKLFFNKNI